MSSSLPVYTQVLLLRAYQDSARELLHALRAAGHEQIRHKHGAVFANLDAEGTRPSMLASRAGMTKPAMGELVAELERLGYVETRPDSRDGRAKLVVPRQRALEVIALVHGVNERIEERYRVRLGAVTYGALRDALERLVGPDVPPQPRLRP